MKNLAGVVLLLAAGAGGCASPGHAEDFAWSIEIPKAMDRGAEFRFVVRATGAAGTPVDGVSYRWQIAWPGGTLDTLRHKGSSGEPVLLHARLQPGTAKLLVLCENRAGVETKVLEQSFEVKQ
jgi:hypothetical protein